eukprot:912562-Prorocentrum_minimum.AAC.3
MRRPRDVVLHGGGTILAVGSTGGAPNGDRRSRHKPSWRRPVLTAADQIEVHRVRPGGVADPNDAAFGSERAASWRRRVAWRAGVAPRGAVGGRRRREPIGVKDKRLPREGAFAHLPKQDAFEGHLLLRVQGCEWGESRFECCSMLKGWGFQGVL